MASSVAALPGSIKSWVLALLAAKRRLRVAPVPPLRDGFDLAGYRRRE